MTTAQHFAPVRNPVFHASNPRAHRRRRAACVHEAGHVLTRWYFGHFTDWAVVLTPAEVVAARDSGDWPRDRRDRPVTDIEGHVAAYDISPRLQTRANVALIVPNPEMPFDLGRAWEVSAEQSMMEAAAGWIAEAVYRKHSAFVCWLQGGQGDQETINEICAGWWPDRMAQNNATVLATSRASALVRSKPGQAAISAIADALQAEGRIEGDTIADVCRAAYGGREPRHGTWHERWPPTLAQLRTGFVPTA